MLLRNFYNDAKEYKNCNIHIKFDKDELELINHNENMLLDGILNKLDWLDTYFLESCYWCTLYEFYNIRNKKQYIINETDILKLLQGKTVILKAINTDKTERNEFLKMLGWEN